MEGNVFAVMRLILFKLIRMDKRGGSHTTLRNLTKGLPSRYLATHKGKKLVQEAIKEANRRFLFAKPSTREIYVSLNPAMAKHIKEFLERFKEV